jgi:tRNA G26 N,N-dimethylase Trm1
MLAFVSYVGIINYPIANYNIIFIILLSHYNQHYNRFYIMFFLHFMLQYIYIS